MAKQPPKHHIEDKLDKIQSSTLREFDELWEYWKLNGWSYPKAKERNAVKDFLSHHLSQAYQEGVEEERKRIIVEARERVEKFGVVVGDRPCLINAVAWYRLEGVLFPTPTEGMKEKR